MLLLTGATLIDGTGADPIPNAAVLIDGDRIDAVAAADVLPAPSGADVIDLSGMTLLPGLIDCHDHFAMNTYGLIQNWGLDEPLSTRHLRTANVLRQTLTDGYTAVRDAGGLDVGFKRAIEQGLIEGPRLTLSLSIVSPSGGIGDPMSASGHDLCLPPSPNLPPGLANGVQEVRAVVRRMVRAGADVIKCATTGGASSRPGHGPLDPAFNADEMAALVQESHALGRSVICHAIGGPGLRIAVEAGVDSIDHGAYLDEDPDLVYLMAEQGTFFVPTLTVYEYHRERSAPHVQQRARDMQPHHIRSIQLALEAGVTIVAGTDAGGHEHNVNARELSLLVDAGLSPLQAIQSATGWAAAALGRDDEIGTVQPGLLADLAVFAGDPLNDINVLRDQQPLLVLQGGQIRVDRRTG